MEEPIGIDLLLFPSTADRAKHYSTTNGVYGDFYGTAIREVKRHNDRHADSDKKVNQLSEELQQAKSCLEAVDYTEAGLDQGQYRPRDPCCYGASFRGKPNCECRLRMPVCLSPDDFKKPFVELEWNCGQQLSPFCKENKNCSFAPSKQDCGQQQTPFSNENTCSFAPKAKDCGQQREPEFLEDHVRCYHPRLAPKPQVLPKVLFGQSNRPLSAGAYVRGVRSGGGFGVGLNGEVQSSKSHSKSRKRPGSPPPVAGKDILPATSRYNFYRYYGYAGQGAKTSNCYRPKP